MSAEPVRVAILGSCISRDVFNTQFNSGYKEMWQCSLLQNQSSLISMMSPGLAISEAELGGDISGYRKQQVRTDWSKAFLEELRALRPDYLLLDFFSDVHFGVLEVAPEQYVTNNRWTLHQTEWYSERRAAGDLKPLRLEEDTEAYLALWTDALRRLQAFLQENLPDTHVILHRGRNAERWLARRAPRTRQLATRKALFKIDVDRANQLWRELDDIASATTGWDVIDLTEREYLSFRDHPWGVFYVHYTPDYYDEFLAALNALHLRRVLGEGSVEAAMAAQIAEARTRRHTQLAELSDEVRRLQGKVVRLQQRIARMRSRLDAPQPRGLLTRWRR